MNVIFDLIGYIGAVLFVAIVILYGVSVLVVFLLDKWVEKVTEGDKGCFASKNIPEWVYDNSVGVIASAANSILWLTIYTSVINTIPRLQDITWIQGLQNISIKLTPFFSYGVSVVVTFLTINWLAKKGYKLSKVVKNLEEKSK